MRPENRGVVPIFVTVAILALMAWAAPASSAVRYLLGTVAAIGFASSYVFFLIRAGVLDQRVHRHTSWFTAIMTIAGIACAAVSVSCIVGFIRWPWVSLIAAVLGPVGFSLICFAIGGWAGRMRTAKTSDGAECTGG
jgi:hypothetical protein